MARDQAQSLRDKVNHVEPRPLWAVAALGPRTAARPFARDLFRAAAEREIALGLLGVSDGEEGSTPILVPAGDAGSIRWGVMRGADAWCVLVETSAQGLEAFVDLLPCLPLDRQVHIAMGPVPSVEVYREAFTRLRDAVGERGAVLRMLGCYVDGKEFVLTEEALFGEGVAS